MTARAFSSRIRSRRTSESCSGSEMVSKSRFAGRGYVRQVGKLAPNASDFLLEGPRLQTQAQYGSRLPPARPITATYPRSGRPGMPSAVRQSKDGDFPPPGTCREGAGQLKQAERSSVVLPRPSNAVGKAYGSVPASKNVPFTGKKRPLRSDGARRVDRPRLKDDTDNGDCERSRCRFSGSIASKSLWEFRLLGISLAGDCVPSRDRLLQ